MIVADFRFNKFSKLTQNTKVNAIFVHVKTTY